MLSVPEVPSTLHGRDGLQLLSVLTSFQKSVTLLDMILLAIESALIACSCLAMKHTACLNLALASFLCSSSGPCLGFPATTHTFKSFTSLSMVHGYMLIPARFNVRFLVLCNMFMKRFTTIIQRSFLWSLQLASLHKIASFGQMYITQVFVCVVIIGHQVIFSER